MHRPIPLTSGMVILAAVSLLVYGAAAIAALYWLPEKGYGPAKRAAGFCLMAAGAGMTVFVFLFGRYVHSSNWQGMRLLIFPVLYFLAGAAGLVLVLVTPPETTGAAEPVSAQEGQDDQRERD